MYREACCIRCLGGSRPSMHHCTIVASQVQVELAGGCVLHLFPYKVIHVGGLCLSHYSSDSCNNKLVDLLTIAMLKTNTP